MSCGSIGATYTCFRLLQFLAGSTEATLLRRLATAFPGKENRLIEVWDIQGRESTYIEQIDQIVVTSYSHVRIGILLMNSSKFIGKLCISRIGLSHCKPQICNQGYRRWGDDAKR